mmetsp:Transcript_42754/g.90891  ORF Transcript_42754/g.90891 Transcript_42754/m.90891 type:complete len:209 (+) Transcript_42754:1448-2074(+)
MLQRAVPVPLVKDPLEHLTRRRVGGQRPHPAREQYLGHLVGVRPRRLPFLVRQVGDVRQEALECVPIDLRVAGGDVVQRAEDVSHLVVGEGGSFLCAGGHGVRPLRHRPGRVSRVGHVVLREGGGHLAQRRRAFRGPGFAGRHGRFRSYVMTDDGVIPSVCIQDADFSRAGGNVLRLISQADRESGSAVPLMWIILMGRRKEKERPSL